MQCRFDLNVGVIFIISYRIFFLQGLAWMLFSQYVKRTYNVSERGNTFFSYKNYLVKCGQDYKIICFVIKNNPSFFLNGCLLLTLSILKAI